MDSTTVEQSHLDRPWLQQALFDYFQVSLNLKVTSIPVEPATLRAGNDRWNRKGHEKLYIPCDLIGRSRPTGFSVTQGFPSHRDGF